MENAIFIGLSKQATLENNINIIANNVANMSTPGFRAQNLLFEEFISDPPGADNNTISMVTDPGHYEVTSAGTVTQTDNPYDIALIGPGFIEVEGPNGDTVYTRAGNFELSIDGTLITPAGYSVLGNGGPIAIPSDAESLIIDNDGTISTEDGRVAKISIVEFENIQSLEALGNNVYATDAASKPAEETRVTQGAIEGSNVNGVVEMTRLINASRKYQSVSRLLQTEGDRLRAAIQKLTEGNR